MPNFSTKQVTKKFPMISSPTHSLYYSDMGPLASSYSLNSKNSTAQEPQDSSQGQAIRKMLKKTITMRLTVKTTFVYRGLRKGLLTAKATQVDKYWNEETQKIVVFSQLKFPLADGESLSGGFTQKLKRLGKMQAQIWKPSWMPKLTSTEVITGKLIKAPAGMCGVSLAQA